MKPFLNLDHVYLVPNNIFARAVSRALAYKSFDLPKWNTLEIELATAIRDRDGLDGGGVRDVLRRVGALMREQCGDAKNGILNTDLHRALDNAHALASSIAELRVGTGCSVCGEQIPKRKTGRCMNVPSSEHVWKDADPRTFHWSMLECLAWTEVENLRAVLGLPEGGA